MIEVFKALDDLRLSITNRKDAVDDLVYEGKLILEQKDLMSSLKDLSNINDTYKLSYSEFMANCDLIIESSDKLRIVRDRLEYLQMLKEGNRFDFDELRKMLKTRNVYYKFPNFNFERYKELLNNPVLKLTNFEGIEIEYDPFIIDSMLIGINQLVFDEMDLRIINVGKEGSGKSCLASQYILYLWWFCNEVGLIKYEYDVTKLFYSSVGKLLEEQEKQPDNDYCRIFCLDEGYELNRQNFREDDSRSYKDSMRSDRKMLRIELINLPQLGELELAITQTRTNFIFDAQLRGSLKTGTLQKGLVNFYTIPRGDYIYSRFHRREIPASEVVNELSRVLKDKNDSYKGIPTNIIINQFNFKGVWGFDKSIYDSFIKKENKLRRVKKNDIKCTDHIVWCMYKMLPKTGQLGMFDRTKKFDIMLYKTWQSFRTKCNLRFETNPELLIKYKTMESEINDMSD